jgi:hypothetical protein
LARSREIKLYGEWNKKGDRHRSEKEPVSVPLRAESRCGGEATVRRGVTPVVDTLWLCQVVP